jgi:hypothetical protein
LHIRPITLLAAALALPAASPAAPPRSLPRFLNGISFAMTNRAELGYDSGAARAALDAWKTAGADAVSLMPFAFQRTPTSAELRWRLSHPGSETDAQMRAGIRAARAHGLFVLVKPHIWVPGSWPGAIAPPSGDAFRSWWTAYGDFIVHHARIAAEEGADALAVGTELSLLQGRPEWGALIARVRAVFPGFVVYAANWDATDVPFAPDLDAVGVDLYAPLSEDPAATDERLRAGAERVVASLDALAERTRRPVLLTEAGYPARHACWMRPNEEVGAVDPDAQRRATEALLFALSARAHPAIRGLFWWKAFSDGRAAEPADGGFRIGGRPAEAALARFFASHERATTPSGNAAGAAR